MQYTTPGDSAPTWVLSRTCAGGQCSGTFNTPIGTLPFGTQVQVALGPGTSSNACDYTIMSFAVVHGVYPIFQEVECLELCTNPLVPRNHLRFLQCR